MNQADYPSIIFFAAISPLTRRYGICSVFIVSLCFCFCYISKIWNLLCICGQPLLLFLLYFVDMESALYLWSAFAFVSAIFRRYGICSVFMVSLCFRFCYISKIWNLLCIYGQPLLLFLLYFEDMESALYLWSAFAFVSAIFQRYGICSVFMVSLCFCFCYISKI